MINISPLCQRAEEKHTEILHKRDRLMGWEMAREEQILHYVSTQLQGILECMMWVKRMWN